MAKKASKKTQAISPVLFLRDKVRKLPLGTCYINRDWQECGNAIIYVTRIHPNGNLTIGRYIVDTLCLGIKSAVANIDVPPTRWNKELNQAISTCDLIEIPYNNIHNIIYGAIEFAEEAGISPVPEFSSARYILMEDSDDIPLISYDYGRDGLHHLEIGPDGAESRFLAVLKKNLAPEMFTVNDQSASAASLMVNKFNTNYNAMMEESNRHPSEPYSYRHPRYKLKPRYKHRYIPDTLLAPDNIGTLPDEAIDTILALPRDEMIADLKAMIYAQIGLTWKPIEDDEILPVTNSGIIYAMMLLGETWAQEALDAILEIMRQSDDFMEYHFGDIGCEIIPNILYRCGHNSIPQLLAYLDEPGLNPYFRTCVYSALHMIAIYEPQRRDEIIGAFRKIVTDMTERLPQTYCCDGLLAGLLTAQLINMRAVELTDELKAMHDTDCVDLSICGKWEKCAAKLASSPDDSASHSRAITLTSAKETNLWLKQISTCDS